MKAIVVNELGNRGAISIENIAAPTAGKGEVLIDVHAVSVNFPDLMMAEGTYQIKPALPFVLGKDAAGTVVATGAGVTRVAAGDRVLVQLHHGAFAERIAVAQQHVFPLPESVSFETAAALGLTYKTAWLGLVERARVEPGESVLVLGASGGVGIAVMQLAKALGARVIAGLTTASKAPQVLAAGADATVDLSADTAAIRDAVLAANHGAGVNIVFDMVGGAALDAALKTVAWEGRVVTAGFISGTVPAIRANYLLIKNIGVLGFSSNTYEEHAPDLVDRAFSELFTLAESGRIAPKIHAVYPLAQFQTAFSEVAERRVIGKVVLTLR